ncbi:hypothetical protein HK44_024095 [Pseudomonas fluorescens HK44]|uniref:Uncharacterized protein n=1 Tax=Pseudomonas fluorescens HK44 TaxID=1042209 RepID=A0A010S573_PSEFL|nr:hypothetical protein HK44_024095 [Pseudomonas fluorescens HK44]
MNHKKALGQMMSEGFFVAEGLIACAGLIASRLAPTGDLH